MEADYNQVEMQIMDLESELHKFGADYTVVFQSTHKLLEKYSLSDREKQLSLSDDRIDFIKAACENLKGRIIYYNSPEIDNTVLGSFAAKVESSFVYQLSKLNYRLNEVANEYHNLFVCNVTGLSAKLGRDFVFDRLVYTNTEMILSLNSLPYIASRTVDIISAAEGFVRNA